MPRTKLSIVSSRCRSPSRTTASASVTEGKDAIGEVTIKVQDNGQMIVGHGASVDIIVASAKAYIDAINKIVHLRYEA